jgi:hypothetical protein
MKKERYFKDYEEFREFYFSKECDVIRNVKNFKHLEFAPIENNTICCDNSVLRIDEDGKLFINYLEGVEDSFDGIIAYANLKGECV